MTRYSVGKVTPGQRREVGASDFGACACSRMYFPKKGSQLTPSHQSEDFKWKDYRPVVFRFVIYHLLSSKSIAICDSIIFCHDRGLPPRRNMA